MIIPKIPENEVERLKELESYSILDTLPEEDFDNLTTIAAEICGTNISLVSLIDDKRQWFKSKYGLDAKETPKDVAFCAHAINEPEDVLIVQDARLDKRFHDNPLVTKDPYVIFYAGVPLVGEKGLPLGTLCVIDNAPKLLSKSQINSLKALSRQVMNLLELRKAKQDLEKFVEKLEDKNRELEQFAALAAHDLKSPLNNISHITKILQEDYAASMEKGALEWLNLIGRSSKKLKGLIEGLLAYNRTDRILLEHNDRINLKELANDLSGLFKGDNNCEILLESGLEEVKTNRTALEQILVNLVSNAIKYGNKDMIKVFIRVNKGDGCYNFEVEDNGPGIPKENHIKIFQLYTVTHSKDRNGEPGNGIGLATVKKLVTSLGGDIRVESIQGKGARFLFNI